MPIFAGKMDSSKIDQVLKQAARIVLKSCLGIKPKEKLVIITDKPCRQVGYVLWEQIPEDVQAILIEIPPGKIHGQEPPEIVRDVLKKCDAFIIPTSYSLTHTKARREATKSGARGATMPGITPEVMRRTLNADYKKIARITQKFAELLTETKEVLIKTEKGTELKMNIKSRKGYADTGLIRKPGSFSNLPAGEAFCAPQEEESEGKVVIDGSFALIGFLGNPIQLSISRGKITDILGDKRIKRIFSQYGLKERTLCEFGIGTNDKAIITGNVLEDEKVLGTVHIAFGNNLGFGGKNDAVIHLDGVLREPSVWFDKKIVIEQGKILI